MGKLHGKFVETGSLNGSAVVDASISGAKIAVDAAIDESKLNLDYSTSGLNTAVGNAQADATQALSDAADAQATADAAIPSSEKGAALGVATLDAGGKVPIAQLPNSIMEYVGVWNATTNSPALADGAGNADTDIGNVYRVSVAGSQDLGSGSISFEVGDYVILNSSKIWEKSDTTDAVASVNGEVGVVVLSAGDIGIADANSQFTSEVVEGALDEAMDAAQAAQSDATQALSDASAAQSDIDNHISDTEGAHAASAISIADANSQFTGTTVEAALDEAMDAAQAAQADATQALADAATADGKAVDAQADVDDLVTLSGVAVNAEHLGEFTGSTIADNSTIKAALQSLETEVETKLDSASLPTFNSEFKTLIAQDITNQYIDLAHEISGASSILVIAEGVPQKPTADFTLSVEGGVTRITFAGDMASLLAAGDDVVVSYTY